MPLRFRLEDLSPAQQAQVLKQLNPPPRARQKDSPVKTVNKSNTDITSSPDNVPVCPVKQDTTIPRTHTSPSPEDFSLTDARTPASVLPPVQHHLRSEKMSSVEKAFFRDVLKGNGWFEPITLKSPSGNRYTPDFLTFLDGVPTLVETKGGFRLQSEGRAHTAFLEAVSNFSQIFQFLWVKRLKGGKWEQKFLFPKNTTHNPTI